MINIQNKRPRIFTSPLITVLVILASIQFCLSTEDQPPQSKKGASLKSALSLLRVVSAEDQKSPREAFSQLLEEVAQSNEGSTRRACCLLLDQYSHFQEPDFSSFLSHEFVASYLKKEDLDENYKNILIAFSLFHGLGGHIQNEGAACDLIDQVRAKAPTTHLKAVGGDLAWKFFQAAGYLSTVRKGRNDTSLLTVLMSAATGRLESALQTLQEVSAYSGLCITMSSIPQNPQNPTNLPSIMAAMKLPMVRPHKTHNHPQMHHFYFLTALATVLQPPNQPPQLCSQPLGGSLLLQSFPCPERLRDVYSCVIELERQRQKENATKVESFVNFTTLQRSPLFQSLFIPLSLSTSTPLQPATEAQILQLKQYFQKDGGLESGLVDRFFEELQNRITLLEMAQIVARLERLRSHLVKVAQGHQKAVLEALILSETFSYTLVQLEWALLKKEQELDEKDKLPHLIAIGLNDGLTNTVLSLAHRASDGTIDGEKYYANIFEDFLFLSAERSPLSSSPICMKPAHAALAVLRGEPHFPGWADPNTLIDIAYKIVQMHPDMVIDWLMINHDERINEAMKRLQISSDNLLEKLSAFVKTSNGKEVKRDVIPYILMHAKLNYLSDVASYE